MHSNNGIRLMQHERKGRADARARHFPDTSVKVSIDMTLPGFMQSSSSYKTPSMSTKSRLRLLPSCAMDDHAAPDLVTSNSPDVILCACDCHAVVVSCFSKEPSLPGCTVEM